MFFQDDLINKILRFFFSFFVEVQEKEKWQKKLTVVILNFFEKLKKKSRNDLNLSFPV